MNTKLTYRILESRSINHSYIYWDNYFSDDELTEIKKYCNTLSINDSTITEGNKLEPQVRKSKVAFFELDQDNHWIFEKLKSITESINNEFFQYDLTGFRTIQYTKYNNVDDHYSHHKDMLFDAFFPEDHGLTRKLSVILFLSDPSEYTGGEFELHGNSEFIIEQKKGRIIAFPSFMMHRVIPVKSGERSSLVFWVLGPKFK